MSDFKEIYKAPREPQRREPQVIRRPSAADNGFYFILDILRYLIDDISSRSMSHRTANSMQTWLVFSQNE